MANYLRSQQISDMQEEVDVDHVTEGSMPFVQSTTGKTLVPIIRKVVLDVPFDMHSLSAVAEGDFVEYGCSLSAIKEWSGFGGLPPDEAIIANYAELHIKYGAAVGDKSGSSMTGHHGQNETYFPEGIPYPFDKIYLKTITKNNFAVNWSSAKIYFTMEPMTANEILAAREEFK